MEVLRKKFIGDKAFYKMILAVAVPIMIQNGITNFVSLLDNIMVGRIGTEQMSGVAIVNQLMFIFFLCLFGGMAGAGIFTAQYFGQKDDEGVRHTFRYKIWIGGIITIVAFTIFFVFGEDLIRLYLNDSESAGDLEATLRYGKEYFKVIFLGMPAVMITQVYVSTLRECGETVVPMKAGICAVFVNLIFNFLLIYGNFGFPELGVVGAGIATSLSRYVEAFIVISWTHKHRDKHTYIKGIYKTIKVPFGIVKKLFTKGIPLLFNECLWSMGIAVLMQCYSERGLDVVAGLNIANTVNNIFNIVFIALGDSVAIIIGQLLGAGKMEEAKDTDNKIIAFSVMCCVVVATVMFVVAPLFPELYNTEDSVKDLATRFIRIQAMAMPHNAFLHAAYFTLRSGGKTIITFLFDCVFVFAVNFPIAYCLANFTSIHVLWIFIAVQLSDLLKVAVGFILVKKNVWLNNIVS